MSAADAPRVDRSDAADCGWSESATLYALGALEHEEATRFSAHVGGCARCAEELDRARVDLALADERLAREQAALGDAPRVSAALRERLLGAIAEAPGAASSPSDERDGIDRPWRRWNKTAPAGSSTEGFGAGMYAITADEGSWTPVGIPGISVKRLATDPARRSVTMLVRMGPGTAYPRHRHGGLEECYVLSGELRVGERTLRAGDYQLCETDSIHAVQSTREGCLLYITSSQDDELL